MSQPLQGRSVAVTGASRGIGLGIAQLMPSRRQRHRRA